MKTFSIAIFGSSLRSNFDKYSDKDLLIVAYTYKSLNKLREKYESQGFSVSTYTYKKLQYLSNIGSLFVQHLKNESTILIDHDSKLKTILSEHKESIPTSKQVLESIEYFKFLRNVPDLPLGYAWFCDCFYVGLRNHLILKSAINSEYNFSFLNLLNGLLESKIINHNDFEILRQLRVLKKNYRERIINELPSRQYIESLIEIGNKLKLISSLNFCSDENFRKFVMNEVKKNNVNHYFKLRFVEIYYYLSGNRILEIDKIISNPQFYVLKFKNNDFIKSIINNIDNKSNKQHAFDLISGEIVKSKN